MKNIVKSICFIAIAAFIVSCEEDEGKLPNISFKSGAAYVSTDSTITKGDAITIGITASKSEDEDVLKKFTISRSVNGGAPTIAVTKNLSGSEGDELSYDYSTEVDTTANASVKYIFMVTNRDGIMNQVALTIKSK